MFNFIEHAFEFFYDYSASISHSVFIVVHFITHNDFEFYMREILNKYFVLIDSHTPSNVTTGKLQLRISAANKFAVNLLFSYRY